MIRLARSPLLALALLALLSLVALPLAAQEETSAGTQVTLAGRLIAAPGSEVELKAEITGVIADFPVAPGRRVAKETQIVTYDTRKLEEDLEDARKSLASAQSEKRRLSTEGRPTSSQPTAQTAEALRAAQRALQFENEEQMAMQDLLDTQTKIAKSRILAPVDGYVVRPLVTTGGKIKRKTPLVVFVPADKVRLEAEASPAVAASLAPGAVVAVTDEAGGAPVAGSIESIGTQPTVAGTIPLVVRLAAPAPFALGEALRVAIVPAG